MHLLQIFWSIFMFFLLVAWIWAVIGIISDVFRSNDLSGIAKGLWVLFIIVVPWLGVLSYLVIRGDGMQERNLQAVAEAEPSEKLSDWKPSAVMVNLHYKANSDLLQAFYDGIENHLLH